MHRGIGFGPGYTFESCTPFLPTDEVEKEIDVQNKGRIYEYSTQSLMIFSGPQRLNKLCLVTNPARKRTRREEEDVV